MIRESNHTSEQCDRSFVYGKWDKMDKHSALFRFCIWTETDNEIVIRVCIYISYPSRHTIRTIIVVAALPMRCLIGIHTYILRNIIRTSRIARCTRGAINNPFYFSLLDIIYAARELSWPKTETANLLIHACMHVTYSYIYLYCIYIYGII